MTPPLIALHTVSSIRRSHGGPSRSVPMTCDAIARCGRGVGLMTSVSDDAADPNLWPEQPGVVRASYPVTHPPGARFVEIPQGFGATAASVLGQTPFKILHDHGLWQPSNLLAGRFSRKHKLLHVISPRGMVEPWALSRSKGRKKLLWHLGQGKTLHSAAMMVGTAVSEADNIRALGLRCPVAVIPNGVDLPQASAFATRNPDAKRLLFMSRVHPKKGLLELVQAWHRLTHAPGGKSVTEGWKVILAGPDEGGHAAEVQAEINRLGLTQAFDLVGNVSGAAKEQALREATAFILPSHSENFGISIAEALAWGMPVLTTTATPWQELLSHQCGWWVEPNVDALTPALSELLQTPSGRLAAMGLRGRKLVGDNYSWQSVGERHVAAYDWLLAGARAGSAPSWLLPAL